MNKIGERGGKEKGQVIKERGKNRRGTGRGESRADVSISFDPPFDRKARPRTELRFRTITHTCTSISFVHTHKRQVHIYHTRVNYVPQCVGQ